MNEHETDKRLRSWARSSSGQPAPAELRRQVLDIPTTEPTTQRRHWLWFLPDREPTAGASGEKERTSPSPPMIQATGGTRTMFSATKLVGIAAAIALFGAVMLAVPLNPPPDAPAPAAPASVPGEVTPFSGSMHMLGMDDAGVRIDHDWGGSATGEQYTARYTTTDPRYSGLNSAYYAVHVVGPEQIQLRVYNGRLFTKEGSWWVVGRGYTHPETGNFTMQEYAIGEGAYEGLFALNTFQEETGRIGMEGVIFEGGFPETPEDAPTEIPEMRGTP